MKMRKNVLLIILVLILFPLCSFSQLSFYWKSDTIFTPHHKLTYFAAKSEPDSDWFMPGFDDSSWAEDSAIIGFGYDLDNYTVIDTDAKSLYVRFPFSIENKDSVKKLNFTVDFDDGYIAYLNGVEISRVNVDKTVQFPPYNTIATRSHASEFLTGLSFPVLGIYLDSTVLKNCLVDGENIMAVHIINDNANSDLMFIPYLINVSQISNSGFSTFALDCRYKRLIDVDSTNLPLVIIETDQNGIAYDQRLWSTAHMGIVNNGEGKFNKPTDRYNEYDGLISIRARGQSSRDFSKKSYRFELVDEDMTDTSFVLLGMPKESDWILFGPYSDKSLIRNKFAYDLAARTGQYAPRSQFCELILNGQLEGVYLLTEQIKRDKERVDISKLKETDIKGDDITGGYIFKYDKPDVFPKGEYFTNLRRIVYPDSPTEEQKIYLKRFFTVYDSIISKTNDFLDPVKGFRKYASDSSLVDFIIINELAKNPDAYVNSTYMYKDRDDKDGRIKFGPVWDFDIAFGNSQFQEGYKTEGWQFHFNSNNFGMYLTRYFEDREFVKLFQDRWHELRAKTYSNDSIFSFFDQLLDQVNLARKRNYEVWPLIDKNLFYQAYYVESYENEIEVMSQWLSDRIEWIDANIDDLYYELVIMDTNPLKSIVGNFDMRIFPNPIENELTIELNIEKEGEVRFEIYNLSGQLQHLHNIGIRSGYYRATVTDPKIDLLQKGMYVAKLVVNNIPAKSLKIIKK